MERATIAILATLDTKGEEVAYMKGLLGAQGYGAMIVDVGPLGPPGLPPDVSSDEVARLSGGELPDLVKTLPRDGLMEAMGTGAAKLLLKLYQEKKIHGIVGIGGNQGTAIASMAMRALPFGFPKYLVSTVASGNIRPYVGCKDIGMVFSVGDLLGGPNAVTRSVLANAVAAVVGMVEHGASVTITPEERTVAVTALGNTEPAVREAVKLLHGRGFQVIPFHASGAGGSAMEELIADGIIHAVLDLTPHELTEEVLGVGAYVPVNRGRLKAAGAMGIPQVVSTGGMEYLAFGPRESIPQRLRRRRIYMHNPYNANVKVSSAEMVRVAETMAERLNAARGPAAVLIPLQGWSVYGAKGGPLHDQRGYDLFLKALKRDLEAHVRLEEVDAHINDAPFARRCVEQLIDFMDNEKNGRNDEQRS
ncbi:MAG: Tm-1-like ATP-binding domain-containing protein [Syntrophorhabdales bacterium]|jgi:uncharacterized protein (UPF0261 family)